MNCKRGLGYLCALGALLGGCQEAATPTTPSETVNPPMTAGAPPPILGPAPAAGGGAPQVIPPATGMTAAPTVGGGPTSPSAMMPAAPAVTPPATGTAGPGMHKLSDTQMIFRTEPFTVPAEGEIYLCWPANAPEAFKVNSFDYKAKPVVHHFLFSRTTAPEPEGFTECDVLYKNSWLPVFAAGASDATMTFPAGVAQEVNAGQQLVVQMHLLNPSPEPITDVAEITMNLSAQPDPIPVNIGVFGTTQIMLPPAMPSSVTHECDTMKDHRIVALLPHMHQLGTSMMLEVGQSAETMAMVYKRDPYDFDMQTIDSMDMLIPAGSHARVTCSYNNTHPMTVTYGESTFEEMCFLVTFTAGPGPACIKNNPVASNDP